MQRRCSLNLQVRYVQQNQKDWFLIFQELQAEGFDDVYLVVGSDRVQAMQWVKKYNGKDFKFRKMEIISSGERDADGDTFAISGTKMRRAAVAGDFKSFRAGIQSIVRQGC